MLPWNATQWTKEYASTLIGQPESARFEFKSGRALKDQRQGGKFVRDQISKTVSGFANSDGGILLLGVEEAKGTRPAVAGRFDGVAFGPGAAFESVEQFQQMVADCISPYLPGIRVRAVPLSGEDLSGRVLVVIYVPPGTTAYQAKDYVYYSRGEFETRPMADRDIRLRMMRSRVAQAHLELVSTHVQTAEDEWNGRQGLLRDIEARRAEGDVVIYGRGVPERDVVEAPKQTFDAYRVRFLVRNSGEITLRDFLLSMRFETDLDLYQQKLSGQDCGEISEVDRVDLSAAMRYRFQERTASSSFFMTRPSNKIFPGDYEEFPNAYLHIRKPVGTFLGDATCIVHWTIYLDDGPPSSGELDVVRALL